MELDDRPIPPRKSYERPSYRSPASTPAPEQPSLVRRWGRGAALVAVLAVGGYFLWAWFFSSSLDYTRVGPTPGGGGQVVVLLHGFGAAGDDFVGLADQLSAALPGTTFLLPEGPHRVGLTGRAWLPRLSAKSRAELATLETAEVDRTSRQLWDLIDDRARKKGAACKDIYVGGFSQGGWVAAEVALRAPPDCALGGVIVMSGGGLDLAHSPATGPARMRVLVTHGTADGVVSIAKGKATAQHFAAGGHEVQWLQFDGAHTIAPAVREAIPGFLRGETVGVLVTVDP